MTTMRDVARVAGVSAKTVSRVFNDDPHVTGETRERRAKSRCGNRTKINVAAEIQFKDLRLRGTQLDEVDVRAKFEGVFAPNFRDGVGKLVPALDAVHRGVRLAPKIGNARNIDADLIPAGKLREAEVQSPPGELVAESVY